MWGYDHGTWWAWLLMSVGMLAVWWLVILGIGYIMRRRPGDARPGADAILAEHLPRHEVELSDDNERLEATCPDDHRPGPDALPTTGGAPPRGTGRR